MKTKVSCRGRQIIINGQPVYSEIPGVNPQALGLLMNQRMIQGVFDDRKDRSRFNQFKAKIFDPEVNTDALIKALPQWHAYGLRAVTVGFQGGWPVGCVDVRDIDNNPFASDGLSLDRAYHARMDRIIRAADALGMVVIVSLLYWAQARQLKDGAAVINAIKTGARFIRENQYTNVILEIANEYNIDPFKEHPLIYYPESMAHLIRLARDVSGGVMVGASGGGGMADPEVVRESDIVLIHGNGLSAGEYYDFVRKVIAWAPSQPIVCNEDSPCTTRIDIAMDTGTSWGYYNNYTKQIPPADYSVTPGEDTFFARRMARAIGLNVKPLQERFHLQGLEPDQAFQGRHAIRLAAEFPEEIIKVDYFRDGQLVYSSYDEPFYCFRESTWLANPWKADPATRLWMAVVHLADGSTVEKQVIYDQETCN